MPSTRPKAPRSNPQKGKSAEKSASRKKPRRKVVSDDEEDDYESPPESEDDREEGDYIEPGTSGQHSQSRPSRRPKHSSMSPSGAPEPDRLFEDNENVDVVNRSPQHDMMDVDIPDRAPTPVPGPSRRRLSKSKKRATAIYSDEDDDYVDAGRKQDDKDDDDFVIDDSPPARKTAGKKGGAGGVRGRGKAAKDKSGGTGEIMIKDERKLPSAAGDAKAGAKRRRETISEANAPPPDSQKSGPTGAVAPSQQKEGASSVLPPSKIRKLPPIKKNKNLAGAGSTAPSPSVSTPSATAQAAAVVAKIGASMSASASTVGLLALGATLPRKPVAQKNSAEVDLSSPDIYNSLFKTGGSSARDGWNSRLKDLQRRKELMKMRDDARAARMANLQKNSFNLLAPQEKVARFEAKLRARNSPAIYPNHLGSALKLISQSKQAGRCVRPFKKDPERAAAAAASASTSAGFGGSRSGSVGGAGDWNIQLPPFLMNRARKGG